MSTIMKYLFVRLTRKLNKGIPWIKHKIEIKRRWLKWRFNLHDCDLSSQIHRIMGDQRATCTDRKRLICRMNSNNRLSWASNSCKEGEMSRLMSFNASSGKRSYSKSVSLWKSEVPSKWNRCTVLVVSRYCRATNRRLNGETKTKTRVASWTARTSALARYIDYDYHS